MTSENPSADEIFSKRSIDKEFEDGLNESKENYILGQKNLDKFEKIVLFDDSYYLDSFESESGIKWADMKQEILRLTKIMDRIDELIAWTQNDQAKTDTRVWTKEGMNLFLKDLRAYK